MAYLYLVYGMHWMLNVVTEPEGLGCAVLIRAAEPELGISFLRARRPGVPDRALCSGPACLCKALDIDQRLLGADLVEGESLFLAEGEPVEDAQVCAGPRIGIGYARREDQLAALRFSVVDNHSVSKAKAKILF